MTKPGSSASSEAPPGGFGREETSEKGWAHQVRKWYDGQVRSYGFRLRSCGNQGGQLFRCLSFIRHGEVSAEATIRELVASVMESNKELYARFLAVRLDDYVASLRKWNARGDEVAILAYAERIGAPIGLVKTDGEVITTQMIGHAQGVPVGWLAEIGGEYYALKKEDADGPDGLLTTNPVLVRPETASLPEMIAGKEPLPPKTFANLKLRELDWTFPIITDIIGVTENCCGVMLVEQEDMAACEWHLSHHKPEHLTLISRQPLPAIPGKKQQVAFDLPDRSGTTSLTVWMSHMGWSDLAPMARQAETIKKKCTTLVHLTLHKKSSLDEANKMFTTWVGGKDFDLSRPRVYPECAKTTVCVASNRAPELLGRSGKDGITARLPMDETSDSVVWLKKGMTLEMAVSVAQKYQQYAGVAVDQRQRVGIRVAPGTAENELRKNLEAKGLATPQTEAWYLEKVPRDMRPTELKMMLAAWGWTVEVTRSSLRGSTKRWMLLAQKEPPGFEVPLFGGIGLLRKKNERRVDAKMEETDAEKGDVTSKTVVNQRPKKTAGAKAKNPNARDPKAKNPKAKNPKAKKEGVGIGGTVTFQGGTTSAWKPQQPSLSSPQPTPPNWADMVNGIIAEALKPIVQQIQQLQQAVQQVTATKKPEPTPPTQDPLGATDVVQRLIAQAMAPMVQQLGATQQLLQQHQQKQQHQKCATGKSTHRQR